MSTSWKSAAIALIALVLAAPPVRAQDSANPYGAPFSADNGYGPPPGYGSDYSNAPQCNPANYGPDQVMPPACMPQAYCDQYGCPDDFYDMPIWYGPVFYDNVWVTGPVYYRVWHGLRQYWIHGGWHYDAWIGPRPSWWNAALYHTGPALLTFPIGRSCRRRLAISTVHQFVERPRVESRTPNFGRRALLLCAVKALC